jgi:predicted Zn-dependent protease
VIQHLVRTSLFFLSVAGAVFADPLPVVAIQPLGPVKPADIAQVKAGIVALYAVTVEILPEKALPKSAYYPPLDRYKADDIVDVLAGEVPAGINKVVVLTARDISTTTDEGKDWGGRTRATGWWCLCDFDLPPARRKGCGQAVSWPPGQGGEPRAGHSFGVDHCPVGACLMQDKEGKIASIDAESGKPCAACLLRLPMIESIPPRL